MFEKKKIKQELVSIDISLKNNENWNDYTQTNNLLKKKNLLESFLDSLNKNCNNFNDTLELKKISNEEDNEEFFADLKEELYRIKTALNKLYMETLMSWSADSKNVNLEINSGAGGVESQDWVAMLFRMYSRWSEASGFKCEIIDQNICEEAGFKSVSLKIKGENCYGWLKLENGTSKAYFDAIIAVIESPLIFN